VQLKPGDHVIYSKTKYSTKPGKRARAVHASEHGDTYSYLVDKYWTVATVHDDGTVTVVTRRGKHHRLRLDDRNLHKADFLTNLLHGKRFPTAAE